MILEMRAGGRSVGVRAVEMRPFICGELKTILKNNFNDFRNLLIPLCRKFLQI